MGRLRRVLLVITLVAVAVSGARPQASAETLDLADLVQRAAALIPLDGTDRPAVPDVRLAVISSGVDAAAFPEAVRGHFAGATTDAIGYGTYASSVVLQLAPGAQITSLNVYAGRTLQPYRLLGALTWAAQNASSLDAVLFAFPPNDYLDPITAAMQAGEWEKTTAAISEISLRGGRGPVFGLPTDARLLWQLAQSAPGAQRSLLYRFHTNISVWNAVRDRIAALTTSGVAVVAPAGDSGPDVQTIAGVATLREVETVGGFSGGAPSSRSASGPSIDGRVKPDVLGPTGIVGLLPQRSVLASVLGAQKLLDASLRPSWSLGAPTTSARTLLDTTLVPAAYVAAAMAGMSAGGARAVDTQRAALVAASVPFDGVPVWRQGAGQLRMTPTADFALSRPLVVGHGDLGAEPESGTWSARLPVIDGRPTAASVAFADFAGVGPDATTVTRSVTSAPPVSASVSEDGVVLNLPLGNDSYEGGLYCGYTTVGLPTTGDEADPRVTANGIPDGTEQVPTCLVEGSRLRAFGFYIHDMAAENLTFGLLPAMPPGSSLLHKPLTLLPVNPLATKLFFKVTGPDGNAYFPNVPPGYYTVRQWSDYGSPVTETHANSLTGAPITVETEIGEEVAYESFPALILSALCTDQVASATGESPCTQEFLEQRFGKENVTFDKPTWTYLVRVAPGIELRIAFDKLKKMPGPAVSSRYIDLLSYGDFTLLTSQLASGIKIEALDSLLDRSLLQTWRFVPGSGDGLSALYNPVLGLTGAGGSQVGIAYYPFNLTTPNYKAHMALDFTYKTTNAIILVIVQMGDDIGVAAVLPQGGVRMSSGALSSLRWLQGYQVWGTNSGKAHFDFHLLPAGAREGKLWLVLVPPVNTVVASAEVGDVSFELDTWVNDLWPPVTFPDPPNLIGTNPDKPTVVAGHSFVVDPNYSARQMSHPGCRPVSEGGRSANVCEDWVVLVHSPGDDASTYDVADASSKISLKPTLGPSGSGFFDPRRGVHDFTHVLAFSAPSIPILEASVSVTNAFRTNGRFWEQLALTKAFLAQHPGAVQFRIVDNVPGRGSALLGVPHADGAVPVGPYVPFAVSAAFLEL